MIEGYLEFLITCFIKLREPEGNEKHLYNEIINYSIGATIFILLPIIFIWFLCRPLEVIQTESFITKWRILFHDIKIKSKFELSFYLIFCIRRIIYVSTAFLIKTQWTQLLVLIYTNLAITIYVGSFTPFKSRYYNRIEIMNELYISFATYQIILFTDFVPDSEEKSKFGWLYTCMMSLHIFSNVILIVFEIIRVVRLIMIKYYRRFKNKK